jgi:hypothetical protein
MIDLGDLSVQPVTEAMLRQPRRRWQIAALIGVLAITVTASGPINSGRLAVVARVPLGTSAHMMIADGRAYVLDTRAGVDQLSAYSLPGGRREWSTTVAGSALNSDIEEVAGTIVATMPQHAAVQDVVEGIDPDTGQVRWHRTVDGILFLSGGLLLNQDAPDQSMSLVNPRTGSAYWTTVVPPGCRASTANVPADTMTDGLVELCPSTGELSVVSLVTGEVQARRHITLLPPRIAPAAAAAALERASVMYVGPAIVVAVSAYPLMTMSAFRTWDLEPIWNGLPMTADDRIEPCGPDICLTGDQTSIIIDPDTGRPVEPGNGRATARAGAIANDAFLFVVPDRATLAAIAAGDLRPDSAVGTASGRSTLVPPAGVAGASIGSTWIAQSTGSAIRLVQPLPGVAPNACIAIAAYIACATSSDQLTLWDLP